MNRACNTIRAFSSVGLGVIAAACAQIVGSVDGSNTGPFEITINSVAIEDSKCAGGFKAQEVTVRNTASRPYDVLPICDVDSVGVELVAGPSVATRIMPGESAQFRCVLEDFADPPDGFSRPASVRLKVFVGGQTQIAQVPVICALW